MTFRRIYHNFEELTGTNAGARIAVSCGLQNFPCIRCSFRNAMGYPCESIGHFGLSVENTDLADMLRADFARGKTVILAEDPYITDCFIEMMQERSFPFAPDLLIVGTVFQEKKRPFQSSISNSTNLRRNCAIWHIG